MHYLKCTLIITLIFTLYGVLANEKPWYDLKDAQRLFEKFQHDFNRHYIDDEDKEMHFEVFVINLLRINFLNSKKDDPEIYGINQFTDHTIKDSSYLLEYLGKIYKNPMMSSH